MRILTTMILIAMCVESRVSYAVDAAILADYNRQVVTQVCKGKTDWLRCYGIDPLTCETHSEKIIDGCLKIHVFDRKTPVQNEAEIQIISQQLYTCIRGSFSQKFDVKRKDSPECQGLE